MIRCRLGRGTIARAAMALASLALVHAMPAAARAVDYGIGDLAFAKDAADLKIMPVTAKLPRGTRNIALIVDPGVDHVTMNLGVYCSAYKVDNPIGLLMKMLAEQWDRDGLIDVPGPGVTTLHLTRARSYRRCVEVKEMNTRCVTRVTLDARIEEPQPDGSLRTTSIVGDVERDASIGGFCGNMARGIAVIGREAGIALIADAAAKLASGADRPHREGITPAPSSAGR